MTEIGTLAAGLSTIEFSCLGQNQSNALIVLVNLTYDDGQKESFTARGNTGTPSDRLRLKKANMVLMTDGGADISVSKVTSDIENLPEGVSTFINFVSIGETNSDIAKVVQKTNTKNSHSMVTFLTPEMMENFIKEAEKPQVDPEAFVFDNSKGQQSTELLLAVQNLKMPSFESQVPHELIRDRLSQVIGSDEIDPAAQTGVVRDLYFVHEEMKGSTQLSNQLRLKVLGDILNNYTRWSGRSLNSLSTLERNLLYGIKKQAEAIK